MRRPIVSIILIMAAAFLCYLPAMRNSFVWDDTALVLRDPLIRHWRLAPEAFTEFLFLDATASDFYRPVQRLTYTADYALWGIARENSPRTNAPDTGDGLDTAAVLRTPQPGWHFTSVLFHALAAVALWRLLRVWLGEKGELWALGGALVWAVHPLHTSAVTYVSGRADSLAALFVFTALAFVAQAQGREGLQPGDRPAANRLIGAGICALLAMLSKEAGVAALVLWAVWVLFRGRQSRLSWLVFVAAAGIAMGCYAGLRTAAGRTSPPKSSTTTSAVERPVLAAKAAAGYAALYVAPHNLHMERNISKAPAMQAVAGALVLAGLAAWAWLLRRRVPDVALALACAGAAWLPVSNLITLNSTFAEHWLYLPSAFLTAALVFTLREFRWRAALPVVAAWLVFLGAQTWLQQHYWCDQRTFIGQTLDRAGRRPRMLANLAGLELEAGRPESARALVAEILKKEPRSPIHLLRATLAIGAGDIAAAREHIEAAKKLPHMAASAILMEAAILKGETGKPRFDLLVQASAAAPREWSALRAWSLALDELGRTKDAYEDTLKLCIGAQWRAEAWRQLAGYAVKLNATREAARAYGEAANRDCRDEFSRERLRMLQVVH